MNAQLTFPDPRARHSDPTTSHEAASAVKPGNSALIKEIRATVKRYRGQPVTAFDIAHHIIGRHPRRWDSSTIRTAVSRAGLRAVDTEGRSPRGIKCLRYSL